MEPNPDQTLVEGPRKPNKVWMIVLLVVVIVCCLCMVLAAACGGAYYLLKGRGADLGTITSQGDSEENGDAIAPLFELPSLGGVELGDEIRAEYCGFSFKQIPDYEYTSLGCFMSISAPGVGDEGPYIALIGGTSDTEMTQEDLKAQMLQDDDGQEVEQFNVKVDGKKGIGFDTIDTTNGVEVKGRVVGVLVNSDQIFTIVGVAPADQWEDFLPKFEAVLKSVKFFTPEPKPTATP